MNKIRIKIIIVYFDAAIESGSKYAMISASRPPPPLPQHPRLPAKWLPKVRKTYNFLATHLKMSGHLSVNIFIFPPFNKSA